MKKLLLLGGSSQQVIAITTAKKMSLYTILCDYLPDNPGQYEADKFYMVSTTDKEAVLEVARAEKIDGIVAYSSDPAAPTAAYVAEKLGLYGVPYDVANAFCHKNLFRAFLEQHGFNTPKSVEFSGDVPPREIEKLCDPIIVKPTDSSGSKGVSVIRKADGLEEAVSFAKAYSRNGIIIAEEFITRDHPDVIEAEVFVCRGQVTVWGLISSIRDKKTNPLLPAAYGYPLNISPERVELVKREVSRLVTCSRVQYGAFNIEMVITAENKLFFLDAGPRNGGNMLPEFIGMIKGQDLPAATIYGALGEGENLQGLSLDGEEGGFWGLAVLHTGKQGILKGIRYSDKAKSCLLREHLFVQPGHEVKPFVLSRDAVGLAFFKFPDRETREEILRDFDGVHIHVDLV